MLPDEIARKGEEIYLDELKESLEKTNLGDYVVIEVESSKYFVNKDLKVALEEAQKEFSNKVFHIVRVGTLQKSTKSYPKNEYAWLF